jgi:hypothetical protein
METRGGDEAEVAGLVTDPERKHLNWLWDPASAVDRDRLRSRLAARNGIAGLELLQPSEMGAAQVSATISHMHLSYTHASADQWTAVTRKPLIARAACRARELFLRDGFVCVAGVLLDRERAALASKAAPRVVGEIVALDRYGGAKGMWQYSFGGCSATGTMLHHPEWAALPDLPLVHQVVAALFGEGYRCYGADGDFNLPGSWYQPLHSDMGDARCTVTDARTGLVVGSVPPGTPVEPNMRHGPAGGGYWDPSGRTNSRDLPARPSALTSRWSR